MDDGDQHASQNAVVQHASLPSDSTAKESISTTKEDAAPSSPRGQRASEDNSLVENSHSEPQGFMQPAAPSEIKSEHAIVTSRSKGQGDIVSAVIDISNSDYSSDSSFDSEQEAAGGALLWCRKTKRSHAELLAWGVSKCPSCRQKVKKPRPKPMSQVAEAQQASTADPSDPTARRRAQFRYSNKFLWSNGGIFFSEPWPDLLDLDRDRGKLAKSQGSTEEPVLEIVTVVATNLSHSRARNDTTWIISNSAGLQCVGKEVIIHSRRVMDAFQTLITYYPNFDLGGMTVLISQPYALFYHHYNEIRAFQDTFLRPKDSQPDDEHSTRSSKRANPKVCDEETYKHLEIVREFIEQENLAEVQKEIDRHNQTPAVATYSMLWLLFKPGTKVYVRRLGLPVNVGVVLSIQGGELSPGRSETFSIDYWSFRFDGTRLGRCPFDFVVKPFVGEKKISELEITPCSFYDAEDSGALRDSLIDRGLKYWRFLSGYQVDYQGKLPKDDSEWVSISSYTLPSLHGTAILSRDMFSKAG